MRNSRNSRWGCVWTLFGDFSVITCVSCWCNFCWIATLICVLSINRSWVWLTLTGFFMCCCGFYLGETSTLVSFAWIGRDLTAPGNLNRFKKLSIEWLIECDSGLDILMTSRLLLEHREHSSGGKQSTFFNDELRFKNSKNSPRVEAFCGVDCSCNE